MRAVSSFLVFALAVSGAGTGALAQGQGPGSNRGAGPGLQNRPGIAAGAAATARAQGALRQTGSSDNGRPGGGASVGAQFGAQASSRGGRTETRGQLGTDANARGMSLHARARATMAARQNLGQRPETSTTDESTSADTPRDSMRGAPWTREGTSRANWLLAKRLAAIDHMRDMAVANGNVQMLDQADKLEAEARAQFERRGGTTPTEPTDPTTPTEPTTPESPSDPMTEESPAANPPTGEPSVGDGDTVTGTADLVGTIETVE